MKITTKLAVLVALVTLTTGCATPYLTDRSRDGDDIFTVVVGKGIGAKARVGPVAAGHIYSENFMGWQHGELFRYRWDDSICGDCLETHPHGGHDVFALLWPTDSKPGLMILSGEETQPHICTLVERNKAHRYSHYLGVAHIPEWQRKRGMTSLPYFTDINVMVGLGLSLKLGFNVGEAVDFVLGWASVDIFDDDIEQKRQKKCESNNVLENTGTYAPDSQH